MCTGEDLIRDVNELIKENKNYLCENYTISDKYDAQVKMQKAAKEIELDKKMEMIFKPDSRELIEEKFHLLGVIRSNANRNMKELTEAEKNKFDEVLEVPGPIQLSKEQIKRIYELIDKR
jgi:hypothetical protein